MTRLADRKTKLTFETAESARYRGKNRPIVVDVDKHGHFFGLRLKGSQVRFELSWEAAFDYAAKLHVDAERHQRLVAKQTERAVLQAGAR